MLDKDIMVEAIMVPEEFAKDSETRFTDPISPNFIKKWVKYIKWLES